jgi:uncharacterized protein YndB with AHSA1/START domain
MRCHVHEFDPRAGGRFCVSLTYDAPSATGKSSAHTDTYHGTFVEVEPSARIVEVLEFETSDPELQGEMRITTTLSAVGGATKLTAMHEGLPSGVAPSDNEEGWRQSLAKLLHCSAVRAGRSNDAWCRRPHPRISFERPQHNLTLCARPRLARGNGIQYVILY